MKFNTSINKIIVLGGGTSGLTSALILKSFFPQKDVTIIESSAVGIIGVGEGSTEHWSYFCDVVGLDLNETLIQTGGTVKTGIMFKNWGYPDYAHSTVDGYTYTYGDYYARLGYMISKDFTPLEMVQKRTRENTLPLDWVEGKIDCPVNNFHFNTFKTNDYLHKVCKDKGITVIDDKITDVSLNDEGFIETLTGEKSTYNADFFIDCTGFARVLMKHLGVEWHSYSKHLRVNSAIAFPTEDTETYPVTTTATALDYGWMWNTPVQGRWGNGYVFDDRFIDFDQAQAEVEKVLGRKVEIAKAIKFDSGKIDKSWVKNCVAVGLSCSFVEPLESTAISQGILQGLLLGQMLPSFYGQEELTDLYNDKVNLMNKNILDFIALHYVSPRKDTEFWKYLNENKEEWMPEGLQEKIKTYSKRLPLAFEFDQRYTLFSADNWIVTLHGMGLIDTDFIRKSYEQLPKEIHQDNEGFVKYLKTLEEDISYISHKEGLEKLTDNYYKETENENR